jgi:hypothetical protein
LQASALQQFQRYLKQEPQSVLAQPGLQVEAHQAPQR